MRVRNVTSMLVAPCHRHTHTHTLLKEVKEEVCRQAPAPVWQNSIGSYAGSAASTIRLFLDMNVRPPGPNRYAHIRIGHPSVPTSLNPKPRTLKIIHFKPGISTVLQKPHMKHKRSQMRSVVSSEHVTAVCCSKSCCSRFRI